MTWVVSGALGALLAFERAEACSGLQCNPDQFVPRSGYVPANLPGVAWRSGFARGVRDETDSGVIESVETAPADLRFQCKAQDGTTRSVTFDTEDVSSDLAYLRLRAPLQPGERCTLESSVVDCNLQDVDLLLQGPDFDRAYLRGSAEFRVTAAAVLPTELGTISVSAPLIERLELSEGAGCSVLESVC
ncbi:MAG TPA: hypothetical protein VJR89_10835, partial [Polyangiales bacterium]|nr:hypothetical protein [Polyangiales bacterium]